MRKHNNLFPTFTNNNPPFPSLFSHDGRCIFEGERPSLSSGHSCSFTKTDFIRCEGHRYGGALYLYGDTQQSSTSIEIIDSTFTECHAEEGAGIYVNTIASLKVSSSFFYKCGNSDTVRGAGICPRSVTNHEIKESLFLSLRSNEDGGALFFYSCTQYFERITVTDNRFLHCNCSGERTPSGGAVETSFDTCPRFGNCLFSHCSATDGGGALWLNGAYPIPTLSYSFFHDNTGTDDNGHDCFLNEAHDLEYFLHCFSATLRSPRVYPDTYEDDWLPQANSSSQLMATLSGFLG